MDHKDLRLGQIVCILVFYNISFSWLLPLDGFQFIIFFVSCLLRDSENEELNVTPTQPLSLSRSRCMKTPLTRKHAH